MNYKFYYDARGKMFAYGTAIDDVPESIYDGAPFVVGPLVDITKCVVDLKTLKIRSMTNAERRELNLPTREAIIVARIVELVATDFWDSPSRSNHSDLATWLAYRQALRDITDAGDAAAMVEAWPLRPDGTDALVHIKADMQPIDPGG